jgi:hypothetical protein
MFKSYLGDSVYVELTTGGMIKLTTNNALGPTNTIYLEHSVFQSLLEWKARVFKDPNCSCRDAPEGDVT